MNMNEWWSRVLSLPVKSSAGQARPLWRRRGASQQIGGISMRDLTQSSFRWVEVDLDRILVAIKETSIRQSSSTPDL
jgi:hypothetical protein